VNKVPRILTYTASVITGMGLSQVILHGLPPLFRAEGTRY
jgi:hypothetical protein